MSGGIFEDGVASSSFVAAKELHERTALKFAENSLGVLAEGLAHFTSASCLEALFQGVNICVSFALMKSLVPLATGGLSDVAITRSFYIGKRRCLQILDSLEQRLQRNVHCQ